ncbi:hypothetical protein GUITHDRAFT_164424, partial [Guillardia theta CCMP2712]
MIDTEEHLTHSFIGHTQQALTDYTLEFMFDDPDELNESDISLHGLNSSQNPCDAEERCMIRLQVESFSEISGSDSLVSETESPYAQAGITAWRWVDEQPNKESAYQESSAATTCTLRNKRKMAEKKQRVRSSQKELLRQLDAFLPPLDAGEARQPRALTPSGRSLFQILEGASKLVRSYMSGVSSDTVREGMRRAGCMLVVEVETETGAIRWMGRGMREYVEAAPWYGDLKEEVTLDLLVHP